MKVDFNQHITSFKGLLGAKFLEDLASSEFYHYSREGQYYYPFREETDKQIDAFVNSNSTIWESEVLGEMTSAETVMRPRPRLNFSNSEYLHYKNLYQNGKPFDSVYHLVDEELKNRGLYCYMNEKPVLPKKSVFKSLSNFIKKLFK